MKVNKKIFLLLLISCIPIISLFANYRINEYKVKIDVQEDYLLNIQEDYVFEFDTERHGFYRVIPYKNYPGHNIKVKNIKVSENNYKIEKSGGLVTIRVGDPDRYVIGEKDYSISYDFDIGADVYEDYDEFYFNVIGNLWECEINNASFEINFPKPIGSSKAQIMENLWLTIGSFGSENVDNSSIIISDDLKTVTGHINFLEYHTGATLRVEMDEGYFIGARDIKFLTFLMTIILVVINVIFIVLAYRIFDKYGRDIQPIEQSRFDPPDGFTPLSLSYFKHRYVTQTSYSASFIYWADKGLIDIVDDDSKTVRLVRKVDFIQVNKDLESKLDYKLFKTIFKNTQIGEEVNLENLDSETLGSDLNSLQKMAETTFDNGLLNDQKSSAMRILIALFAFVSVGLSLLFTKIVTSEFMPLTLVAAFFYIVLSIILLSGANSKWIMYKSIKKIMIVITICVLTLVYGFVTYLSNDLTSLVTNNYNIIVSLSSSLSVLILLVIFSYTEKRSEYSQNILEQLLGYTSFIRLVQVDQIETMIEDNPDFYFKHLSYALVLDLTNTWEKKFAKIEVTKPNWYICPSYGYYSFARMNNLSSSLNKQLNVPMTEYAKNHSSSSSTSSGFSGSVGGGAGGGGGGAW